MTPKTFDPRHSADIGRHTPYDYQSYDEGRIQTGPPLSQPDAWVYDRTHATGEADRIPRERNHVGRGPKSYQRADEVIKDEICHRLTEDAFLDASSIEVEVKDRVVTLKGSLATRREKRHAEDVADRAKGVRDVRNQIELTDDTRSVRIRGLY
jgi:hypothetical protein